MPEFSIVDGWTSVRADRMSYWIDWETGRAGVTLAVDCFTVFCWGNTRVF